MGIKSVVTTLAGEVNVVPNLVRIYTTDSLSTVVTAGYLNTAKTMGYSFNPTDIVFVAYSGGVGQFSVSVDSDGLITLSPDESQVVFPVTANHIAVFTSTTGSIGDDVATAINGGNIQAGLSGTAGYLASFPSTALKGSLRLQAAAASGDTVTTITNATMGQATTLTIPDPSSTTASFLLTKSGVSNQHITAGSLYVDAGILASGLTSGGFAGRVIAYSLTATAGYISMLAADNGSGPNFGTTISNSTSQGQAQVITVPDAGAATASFVLTKGAASTQSISTGINITGGANNLQVVAGNVLAGSSGSAGYLISYPTTASKGTLQLKAADSAGNTDTVITNASFGQATTLTIPDPAAVAANMVVAPTALVNNNLVKASGTAGLVADAGVAVSNVQLKTDVKAAQSADIGGGGAGPIAVSVTGLTAASVVVASIVSSTNAVSISKVAPGSGSFNITFSADPGASCVISYVAYIAAQ